MSGGTAARAAGAEAVPPLHVVTDDRVLGRDGFVRLARAVLTAGGAGLALHLRGPGTSGRRLHDLAVGLRGAAREAGATLLVNDRVDVALTAGLDGVHLGERSLPVPEARRLLREGSLVGASVHAEETATDRAGRGADFLVVGTIFATPSHPGRPAAGTELLSGVRRRVSCPVVAIGGVTPDRVPVVLGAGADGVAVLRGVWDAVDPAAAATRYAEALATAGWRPGRAAHNGGRVREAG